MIPPKKRSLGNGGKNGQEADESYEPECKHVKKHTLDSDEEEEEEKKMVHAELQEIGQEPNSAIDFEGNIRLTPFNMNEEMEEGFFDENGCYHWNVEEDKADAWLENIEWDNINTFSSKVKDDSSSSDEDVFDKADLFMELLEIVQPGETVMKCIKRLGGNRFLSSKERWSKKKKMQQMGGAECKRDPILLEKVTGLADRLLSNGILDIYEYTYERMKFLIEHKEKPVSVDIFAEDDSSNTHLTDNNNNKDSEVKWVYKMKNDPDEEVHGPFTSIQMQEFKMSGKFSDGAWCRRINDSNPEFFSTRRIDFDLYI